MDMENIIMELVVNGGDAKSKALEAITVAGQGRFDLAEDKMKECEGSLNKAHTFQTDLIQRQLNGENLEVNLLLVHGQDHLMNAITVRDLAFQMIELYKFIYQKK